MSIEFYGFASFGFDQEVIGNVLRVLFRDYGKELGRLTIVMMSDEELLAVNREFLGHDYYTDVITFPINMGTEIDAEIYVSIERIAENGKGNPRDEMYRVLIHGCLHLCGYGDNTPREKETMTELENKYLAIVPRGTI